MSRLQNSRKAAATGFALLFILGLLIGGLGIFYFNGRQINNLNTQVSDLQAQIEAITTSQNVTIRNDTITIYQNGTSLIDLYASVRNSVVLVAGNTTSGSVQGSGFVYNYSNRMVVLTNFHVVQDTTTLSVTFSDGNGYEAKVLGTDPYADLAVISFDAPASEFQPLAIVRSSSLRVGEQVIAIGNPYGLVGSLTTGVVSAVGRSEQADFTSSFSLANMIQTSTPINPGNSGGPLLNMAGEVVGITNSIVTDSQGLGFAVPSNTILRELPSLIATGSYRSHPYLGISSDAEMSDMNYDLAQQLHVNVTYGRYVGQVVSGGPADGHLRTGDIIIAMNGTRIRNGDDLASYLEENTLPNDLLQITVVRDNAETTVSLTLGTRPPPNL